MQENNDWRKISMCIPQSEPFSLKYKFFTYMKGQKCNKRWTDEQDLLLKRTIK